MKEKSEAPGSFPIVEFLFVLVGFAFAAWFLIQARQSQAELKAVEAAHSQVKEKVIRLETRTDQRLLELRALENDPFAVEQRLRQNTGKVRPGEIVPNP